MDLYDGNIVRIQPGQPTNALRFVQINKKNGQIILGGQITKSIASTSSTLSTASSASTDASSGTTSSPSPSSSTQPIAAGPLTASPALPSPSAIPSSSGLSGGAKAGIAIGIIAGVALVSGLAFLLLRERRKRKTLQQKGQDGAYGSPPWQPELDAVHQVPPQEMSAHERQDNRYHMRAELPNGQGRPQELYS
ncbi:MAG: hypothetical protein LQ346_007464 [Caloplaca aetnensis]|nr:MAG: hypothetical protein LQ346_007464 [Caloplaca aetnensis]